MKKAPRHVARRVGVVLLSAVISLIYGWTVVSGSAVFSGWIVGTYDGEVAPARLVQFTTLWTITSLAWTLLTWKAMARIDDKYVYAVRLFLLMGAGLVLVLGAVLLGSSITQQKDASQSSSLQNTFPAIDTADLYRYSDEARQGAGLAPLRRSEVLEKSACMKVSDMIEKDYWGHDSPDGISPWFFFDSAGYVYHRAGENLAYGYSNGQSVIQGWMASPTHRANVLGDYEEVGFCAKIANDFQGHKNNVIVGHYGLQEK